VWSATALTAVASTTANLLGYVFNLLMTRALGVRGYGELAALLAVIIVAIVPGTALQAAIARRVTSGKSPTELVRTSVDVSVAVCVIIILCAPVLKSSLHISSYWPVLWTALSLVPLTIAFAWQGVLQGKRHFLAMGALLVAVQLARVGGGVVAAVVNPTSSTALGVMTVLTLLIVAVITPWVRRQAPGQSTDSLLPELVRDISPIFGVLVLSNLDLLLARHYLGAYDSGLYAAGNLVTRAFFWGPAFLALSGYPRFATPAQRQHALRHSAWLLGVISAVGMAISVVGAELVPLLLGPAYQPVASVAWLFAADGLALAAVQLALYAGLAVHDRRIGRLVWIVAVSECIVVSMFLHDSARHIIAVALTGGLVLLVAAVTLEVRRGKTVPVG
jgi:O-antigen/teichoic acid export membrane protein